MMRRFGIVVLLMGIGFGVGCAGAPKRGKLDYCKCRMWGVSGVDQGPGYRPPPRPIACKAILKKKDRSCAIPP